MYKVTAVGLSFGYQVDSKAWCFFCGTRSVISKPRSFAQPSRFGRCARHIAGLANQGFASDKEVLNA